MVFTWGPTTFLVIQYNHRFLQVLRSLFFCLDWSQFFNSNIITVKDDDSPSDPATLCLSGKPISEARLFPPSRTQSSWKQFLESAITMWLCLGCILHVCKVVCSEKTKLSWSPELFLKMICSMKEVNLCYPCRSRNYLTVVYGVGFCGWLVVLRTLHSTHKPQVIRLVMHSGSTRLEFRSY